VCSLRKEKGNALPATVDRGRTSVCWRGGEGKESPGVSSIAEKKASSRRKEDPQFLADRMEKKERGSLSDLRCAATEKRGKVLGQIAARCPSWLARKEKEGEGKSSFLGIRAAPARREDKHATSRGVAVSPSPEGGGKKEKKKKERCEGARVPRARHKEEGGGAGRRPPHRLT